SVSLAGQTKTATADETGKWMVKLEAIQAGGPVWGWAEPAEKVSVSLAGQTKTATADETGKWMVKLEAIQAGGPHVLSVEGNNAVEIADVMVGEVWLCSGQSNMAWTVERSANRDTEIAEAKYPGIRMMTVARVPAETPQDNCQGEWRVCSPETVAGFSATAYFFGRKLHRDLDVPVGLINSSWGGTPVQSWTSLEDQRALPELKPLLDGWDERVAAYDPQAAKETFEKQLAEWKQKAEEAKAAGKKPPRRPRLAADPRLSSHRPANLYNGMIAPLAPYALRGAIWYQGESNSGSPDAGLYGLQLTAMIKNWRQLWQQGEFPFLWVQLPNFRAPQQQPVETSGWVIVQNEMLKTLSVPNTGMAVTIDVGEAGDIHPKNKQDVGRRLALWALGTTYGRDIVYCGPLYKSMRKRDSRIVIQFDHVGGGLVAKDSDELKGFAIAGEDKKFVWARARIRKDRVVVSSRDVESPVAVRYAWAANPSCNLYNQAGLPASPFRTDDWEE
ncbi:MAG: sialate O-acetylesterase, partial [Planctomycetota bacterium]